MSKVELKKHKWELNGEKHSADFFPFIDGLPRHDLADCSHCIYGESIKDGYCNKGRNAKHKHDPRLYLFCGPICGYFELKEKD